MQHREANGDAPPFCTIVRHPLVRTKLALLHAPTTDPALFRQVAHELAMMLAYEATSSLRTADGSFGREALAERVAIVPVMRGGLGIAPAMLQMLPTASVMHVGIFREASSAQPVEYYNRLPRTAAFDVVFVLDAQIKTGNTAEAAVAMVREMSGPPRVVLVTLTAQREGLDALRTAHPDVRVYTAAIEEGPSCLGDATDRFFGATPE